MEPVSGANYIGYQLLKSGARTYRSLNPATGEEFPTVFYQATPDEVDRAVQLAQAAFESYSVLSPLIRAAFLERIAEEMQAQAAVLEASFVRESALPADRAHTERIRTCFQLTSFAEALRNGTALHAVIDPARPDRKPTPKPDLRKVNAGIGPVVVFGASNFPFAYSTIGGDSASALAAGCPVIVKGHPMHPGTSELVAQLVIGVAQEFNLPEGVFSHVHAIDFTVGEQLVSDERVQAVGFTGSFKGGMALHHLSQSRKQPIPVFAEMGSVNPIVVLPVTAATSMQSIVDKIVQSVSLNAGQFCTSPGLLFMEETEATEAFVEQLTIGLSAITPQCMLHPGIKAQYKASRELQRDGAQLLVNAPDRDDNYITPALFAITGKQFLAEPHRQEEVFGAFLQLIRCTDSSELVNCLTQLNGQLTGSVFFSDSETEAARKVVSLLQKKVGRVILNGVPTGVEVSPAQQHGGVFPASTDSRFTAVGADAIARFMRPVTFQNCPDEILPEALKRANPLRILRFVNGLFSELPC